MGLKVLKKHVGMKIGEVTLIDRIDNNRILVRRTGEEYREELKWLLQCSCGTVWEVPDKRITTTSPRTCKACQGKHRKKPTQHVKSTSIKKTTHPNYGSWYAMIRRCTSTLHQNYYNYGGRGITVDPAWLDFEQFVRDMGERPPNKTLDRIDNDKGYSKDNCRWATAKEQRANTRPKPRK